MTLYAERTFKIDTENAFKVGPHIVRVEKERSPVVKLNLGEPDFPVPVHIKDEIKRQLDLDNTHYCDPQGLIGLRRRLPGRLLKPVDLKLGPSKWLSFLGGSPQSVWLNRFIAIPETR